MCEIMDGQLGLFDQGSWSGRMYPERSQAESQREQTSQRSSKKSSKSQSRMPVCLCVYPTEDGQNRGATTLRMVSGQLLGDYTMHSFGESPSEENASRLSQILEDSPPPEILFERKGLRWYPTESGEAGQGTALGVEASVREASRRLDGWDERTQTYYDPGFAE